MAENETTTNNPTSKRAASRSSSSRSTGTTAGPRRDEAAAGRAGAEAANREPTVPEVKDAPGVASSKDNAKLEHTNGGVTTRDDRLDLGVPMLQGDGSEPTGPEDALGEGPKRGDYSDRLGYEGYHPHTGNIPQKPRASERGEVKGRKGGVDTADSDRGR